MSSPGYGLLWDILPTTTLFASYLEGLEAGGTAPSTALNANVILAPAISTQKEIGLRDSYFKGLSISASYFEIDRANAITDPVTNIFGYSGKLLFKGVETTTMRPDNVARAGIAFCPEERGIFASLSVTENLMLPPQIAPGGMSIAEIHTLFPNLKERAGSQGTKLSGGEQQMLAIGRILRTGARLLLLDEPTEGLAPVIVQQIRRTIAQLKARGFTILLVEQNFRFAATVADRHYVVEHGRVIDMVPNSELGANMNKLHEYLGV